MSPGHLFEGVLDEGGPQSAPFLTSVVQAEPLDERPAAERIHARIVHGDEVIYVGVVLHDSNPSQIANS